jgi:putative endonuclease
VAEEGGQGKSRRMTQTLKNFRQSRVILSNGMNWFVYIARCRDGTLYTGITRDLKRRMAEHNSDNGGAKYTRFRQPVRLVYSESVESRSMASKREYQLKRMSRAEKQALIGTIDTDRS